MAPPVDHDKGVTDDRKTKPGRVKTKDDKGGGSYSSLETLGRVGEMKSH